MIDPYSVLGIVKTASADEVKHAYRKLAKKYHPDMPDGDAAKFKAVNEAYNHIKNPPKEQAQYDQWSDFEGMFAQHFGGKNPFVRPQQSHNSSIKVIVHITLEDLYNNKPIDIDVCYGQTRKQVTVKIPKGVKDGDEIRYAGYGTDIHPGPPGNLFVTYCLKSHVEYIVEEHDLVKRLNISIKDAMIGTEQIISTLDGRTLKVNIKPGTQSKTRLRIPECGLPRQNLPNGNLYIEINVQIPKLSKEDLNRPLNEILN